MCDDMYNIYKDIILWDFIERTKTSIYFTKKSSTTFSMTLKRNRKQITFTYSGVQDFVDYPELNELFKRFLILFPISYDVFVESYEISDKKIYEESSKDYKKLSKLYTDDELSMLLYI